jgi:uncharacterized protein (DUF433 family)
MTLPAKAEPVPLRMDDDGVIRVGETQVALERLIDAHRKGATPERIAGEHPDLAVADVYGAIGYFLRHREEVEAYLERRSPSPAGVERLVIAPPSREETGDRPPHPDVERISGLIPAEIDAEAVYHAHLVGKHG